MTVSVTPETFTLVEFDSAEIASIVERLLVDVGFAAATDVSLHVDEQVPMGATNIASLDPIVLEVEGGALEDPKRPRHLSDASASDVLGRLLWRVNDHRNSAFGAPAFNEEIDLSTRVAWDVYCVTRLARKGYRAQKQRRLYAFRNRHGFTNAADAAFEEIWNGVDLAWLDIETISRRALDAREVVSS